MQSNYFVEYQGEDKMKDYRQIKIDQYQTCIIVPFSYDNSFFEQMLQEKEEDYKEEDRKKKAKRDYSRFCFKEFFQKIQITNSEPFNEKAKEWFIEKDETNTEKLVLQCYEFRDQAREKIGLNKKRDFIYTLEKEQYKFRISKIKSWFFKAGQGFLTLELQAADMQIMEDALAFNGLRWVNRKRKFTWRKKISRDEEVVMTTDIKEVLEKCLESLKNVGVENWGIMEDRAYFLSVLISDGGWQADNKNEILPRLCLKYSMEKMIADAQKNAMEFCFPYEYLYCGICGNTVTMLVDCFQEKSLCKEQSNRKFLTQRYPEHVFSHYLITYLYYLTCYKNYRDLSEMLTMSDKIDSEEIERALFSQNKKIEEVGSTKYVVLNDIFYKTLCEKIWNLPEKIEELKEEYKKYLNKEYDIFISYRHDGGQYLALLLYEHLKEKGMKVFLDVHSMRVGHFDEQIYDVIESCKYLLLVVSHDCMERLVDQDDWVAKELVKALEVRCEILPIYMEGMHIIEKKNIDELLSKQQDVPDKLKELLEALPTFQSLEAKVNVFDSIVDRIMVTLEEDKESN